MHKIEQTFSFLILVIPITVILSAGCEKKTEVNKVLTRRAFEEVWNQEKLDVVDEIFSTDFVEHRSGPDIHGPESVKELATMYSTAFPDLKYTIEDQIAEGDMVVCRWTATCTHKGELMGIPPTGVQVTSTGVDIFRITDGKIVELWANVDELGTMQQLGMELQMRE
ncbi:ester cyclase [bacterium]|nr:ester cyclase [bacterium]RQV99325.1 MAG: ester cyclase [bacterium]